MLQIKKNNTKNLKSSTTSPAQSTSEKDFNISRVKNKLLILTNSSEKIASVKAIIAIQMIYISYRSFPCEASKDLEKFLEKHEVHLDNDYLVSQIYQFSMHNWPSLIWFHGPLTQEIVSLIEVLGFKAKDEFITSLIKQYSDPLRSFLNAVSLNELEGLENYELALELIEIFGQNFKQTSAIQSSFCKLINSSNFSKRREEPSLCLRILRICGKETIGNELINQSLLNSLSLDEGLIQNTNFINQCVSLCGKGFFKRATINQVFKFAVAPNSNRGGLNDYELAIKLIEVFGFSYFEPVAIIASFERSASLVARDSLRSLHSPFECTAYCEYLIDKCPSEVNLSVFLARINSHPRCPTSLHESIARYVARNPHYGALNFRPHLAQASSSHESLALEIHSYAGGIVLSAAAAIQRFLLRKAIKQGIEVGEPPCKNIQELNNLIEKVLAPKEALKAKSALENMLTEEKYLKKVELGLGELTQCICFATVGLSKELENSTQEQRLKLWLTNSLIEAQDAYGPGKISCPRGVYERLFITGLRGMWSILDGVLMPSEYFRYIPENSSEKDPKLEVLMSDDFTTQVSYKIKEYNQLQIHKDEKFKIPTDGDELNEKNKSALSKFCALCFEDILYKNLDKILQPTRDIFTKKEMVSYLSIYNKVFSSKSELIRNFTDYIQDQEGFMAALAEKID